MATTNAWGCRCFFFVFFESSFSSRKIFRIFFFKEEEEEEFEKSFVPNAGATKGETTWQNRL